MLARGSKHRTAFASKFGLACAHARCMLLMVCIREACVRPTGSSWLASHKPPQVACTCVTIVIVRSDRGSKVTSGACSLQLVCSGCICDALRWFAWPGRPAVSDPKASSGLRIWKRGQIVQSIPSQPKVSSRRVRGRILPSALRHRKRHTAEALRHDCSHDDLDLVGSVFGGRFHLPAA